MMENSMSTPITLLSLNMHCGLHGSFAHDLILKRRPEIICLQEVQKPFAEQLTRELGYDFQFSLRAFNAPERAGAGIIEEGVMIAWHPSFTLIKSSIHAYQEEGGHVPLGLPTGPNDVQRTLLVAQFEHGGEVFRIGTTHFTWTPDGSASNLQRGDMQRMLHTLKQYHDEIGIVFCGDFNAPRGGEIFQMMSDIYVDNLPPQIETTLDQVQHRSPMNHRQHRAVDSIFSTKEYQVKNVEVVDGVSDHVALFAQVSKSVG